MNSNSGRLPLVLKILKKIFTNKFVIATAIFTIWMTFFDTNDFFTHKTLNEEIDKLESEKEYYHEKLLQEQKSYNELKFNKEAREKYARENYFMKKNNEDIFIIVHQEDTLK